MFRNQGIYKLGKEIKKLLQIHIKTIVFIIFARSYFINNKNSTG